MLFPEQPLVRPSLFKKLFKIPVKENFIREINNLLSVNETDFTKISQQNINSLVLKYKIKNIAYFENYFKQYFINILTSALSDDVLTEQELKSLRHIKDLFNISEEYVKENLEKATAEIFKKYADRTINDGIITEEEKSNLEKKRQELRLSKEVAESILEKEINDKGEEIYRNNVKWSIYDGELTSDEKENLKKIKETLGLSEETADNIYSEEASKIYQRYVDNIVADQRISPEEEKLLIELKEKLDLDTINMDYSSRKMFDKYKLFWLIENGDVPTITSPINIQKSEKMYFTTNITWHELRKEYIRTTYSGLTYTSSNILGIKGLKYRNGSITPHRISEDVLKPIDTGTMYLTNKRIIFTGTKGNKTINLSKVLSYEVYSDGIQINKDSGKSPFFQFSNDIDLMAVFLSRALSDI